MFFFFFQAEDGIRDLTVTGVQTCALPISMTRFTAWPFFRSFPSWNEPWRSLYAIHLSPGCSSQTWPHLACLWYSTGSSRSEERRVGEECRSRWSPDHLKKKKKNIEREHNM